MPATDYDDPLLDMSEEEIVRRNVRMGRSARDPDMDADEEQQQGGTDEQAEIWAAIENGKTPAR